MLSEELKARRLPKRSVIRITQVMIILILTDSWREKRRIDMTPHLCLRCMCGICHFSGKMMI